MNKQTSFFLALISTLIISAPAQTLYAKAKRSNSRTQIYFEFNNEKLIDVINKIAGAQGNNVILPMGGNKISSNLTISIDKPVSLDEAWDMLYTMLDLAGYSMIPKADGYEVVATDVNTAREPLRLFIGTSPDKLPDTDERIRLIYYFANMQVSGDSKSPLADLLKALVPDTSSISFEATTNALIITEKASTLRSIMEVLVALDNTTFKEKLEIIPLRHTSADVVAKLFNDNIIEPVKGKSRYRLDAKNKGKATYFSKFIKVIPENRTNSLIVLGRSQAVERTREFIHKYIDVEIESGRSVLHIYELQYLDAAEFKQTLENIIESTKIAGAGQATTIGGASGVQRSLEGVIIRTDTPATVRGDEYAGGNNIVIAARNDDWRIIKQLIEELDRPQPQVIIEVLIADLTLEDSRLLGSMIRNPAELALKDGVAFQAMNLNGAILDDPTNPTTLAADLLGRTLASDGSPGTDVSYANLADPGSTLLSFNDKDTGETWGILQLLKLFNNSKIISHPHVVATHNKQAFIKVGESRLLRDEASPATSGATTIQFAVEEAETKVTITPRVSANNTVNLEVKVEITEFTGQQTNTRIKRFVETNANVKDKDILALGGLVRTDAQKELSETPLLSKIPIIGYLFKRRRTRQNKTNLTVFISPTIVQPRLRGGVSQYTKDYVKLAKKHSLESELFDCLREPVTRWFFKTKTNSYDVVDDFLAKDEFKSDIAQDQQSMQHRRRKAAKPKERIIVTGNKKARAGELRSMLRDMDNPLAHTKKIKT